MSARQRGSSRLFLIPLFLFVAFRGFAQDQCALLSLLGGAPSQGISADANPFLPMNDVLNVVGPAINRSRTIFERYLRMRRTPPMQSEAQRAFLEILYEQLHGRHIAGASRGQGGILFLDTPALAGHLGSVQFNGRPLFDLAGAGTPMVMDHHGIFFRASRPDHNTTMQVLSQIRETADVDALLRNFGVLTTDNLGDAALAITILRNRPLIDRIRADSRFYDLIRIATRYEDFGVFGTEMEARAQREPGFSPGIELGQALLAIHDRVIRNHNQTATPENRLTADRINTLPKEVQQEIIRNEMTLILRAINDPLFRTELATEFSNNRQRALASVTQAHQGIAREIPEGTLNRLAPHAFVYDGSLVNDGQGSIFAPWAAPANVHSKNLSLDLRSVRGSEDPPGTNRTYVILSIPDGRAFPAPVMQRILADLRAAHLEAFTESIRHYLVGKGRDVQGADLRGLLELYYADRGLSGTALQDAVSNATARENGAVNGRDALVFSFTGFMGNRTQVAQIIARAIEQIPR